MRDPQRIWKINHLINAIWLTYPDMRFFQLVDSIKSEFNKLHPGYPLGFDFFYVEDDKLIPILQTILEKGFSR